MKDKPEWKILIVGGPNPLIAAIDELNDLAEGVLAEPVPKHLDREEVNRKTGEAFRKLTDKAQ